MKKVEITFMDENMVRSTSLIFINVVKISEAKKNLIIYFKDGTKKKVPNDKWFQYVVKE